MGGRAQLSQDSHLTQPVEENVEVGQHGAAGHLDDVVEGLAGVVAQPAVRVIEACQHRLDQLLQVKPRVLRQGRRRQVSNGLTWPPSLQGQ